MLRLSKDYFWQEKTHTILNAGNRHALQPQQKKKIRFLTTVEFFFAMTAMLQLCPSQILANAVKYNTIKITVIWSNEIINPCYKQTAAQDYFSNHSIIHHQISELQIIACNYIPKKVRLFTRLASPPQYVPSCFLFSKSVQPFEQEPTLLRTNIQAGCIFDLYGSKTTYSVRINIKAPKKLKKKK